MTGTAPLKPSAGLVVSVGRTNGMPCRYAIPSAIPRNRRKAASGKADFYWAYHVDQVGVASQDKFGGYDWWSGYIYVGAKYQKEGSLTLDVRDAGNKLVWRANKTAIVGTSTEAVGRDIDDAVSDLLSKFPPKSPGEHGQ